MLDFSKHFPYKTPREIQRDCLQVLSDSWDSYDVFVIIAPTAFGKTALARTLMNALNSVSCITPTNQLVDQFLEEFPETPTLARLDSYHCPLWKRPCSVTRNKCRNFCRKEPAPTGVPEGCPASRDLATAKFRRGPGIYNYHTYLAHKLHRDVLVVDEAHNLLPTIRERLALCIWQHDYKYPHTMYSPEQMGQWIASLPAAKQKHKKIELLRESVRYKVPRYTVQRTMEPFNGKGTMRGQPEMRDCLKLLPVDISDAPPMFWPGSEVKKTVLMSATIGAKDIEQLGLGSGRGRGRQRVLYIDCASPISPGNRPIVAQNVVSVNHRNMNQAAELLANHIEGLAAQHPEKGIIHASYQMARLLQPLLDGPRYLFHSKSDKRAQYEAFRKAPASSGRVLIACGMYEGIDLPEDLGRWQVISKIPWQSLGNPAVKHLAELDPDWYMWETIKVTIQACGRICRTPDDFGITYILDSTFNRILEQGGDMLPKWFTDALYIGE